MQPEQLNSTLLWCLRIACPVFLVLFVRHWRWHWPMLTVMIMAYWVRWLGFYQEYNIEPTRTSDAILAVPKILATGESLWWLYASDVRPQRWAWLLMLGFGLVGGAISAGAFGFHGQWDQYESARLMLHAFLVCCLVAGLLYRKNYGMHAPGYVWRHAILMLALFVWHIAIRMWPLPAVGVETQEWDLAQVVFRAGYLTLLALWLPYWSGKCKNSMF